MIRVDSEIGRLRRALVHEPGPEVDRMVPSMMEELLFDDILHGDGARDEHARYRRILQLAGVQVVDAIDLLRETLEVAPARAWVFDVMLDHLERDVRDRLSSFSAAELATTLVAGLRTPEEPDAEQQDLWSIAPLPNWCFQRDPQIILGNGVIFGSMAAAARRREALLSRFIFRNHPDYRNIPVLFDPIETLQEKALYAVRESPHLEGGDVLVLSEQVLAVGLSERTNRTGIRYLARALSRREQGPRWLVVVQLPRRRAYMHLDTLMTLVDRETALVHAPVILPGGAEEAPVYEIDLHADNVQFRSVRDGLLARLRKHGVDLDPIPCGGSDSVSQQREQWTDGANAMALAPGVITLFDRNLATADELSRRDFDVLASKEILLGQAEVDLDASRRACILISSHEISRARGGPHCLTHPLLRDAI